MEIKDYEHYKIYNNGEVFNTKTNTYLKPWIDNIGYKRVALHNNDKRTFYRIHRLIALYYIPNPNSCSVVDHINRIRTDNRIDNLRWVTQQQNCCNLGLQKNNTVGHKNISMKRKSYLVQIKRYGLKYNKVVKTLEEAIKLRDLMLSQWE